MKNYKIKVCLRCGKEFKPNSPAQKYCEECMPIVHKECMKQYMKTEAQKQYRKQYELEHREQISKRMQEWRAKHSEYDRQWNLEHLEQKREMRRKCCFKRRRNLGYIPLNSYHGGDEFHHQDKIGYGIYMDKEAHQGIRHNIFTGQGMDEINALAMNYIGEK